MSPVGGDPMTDELVSSQVEHYLQALSHVLTQPFWLECLECFVARMLDEFGCDNTLRWAVRYRDLRVPRATRLERRLGEVGAFCDCEIFLNGYRRDPDLAKSDAVARELRGRPLCCAVVSSSTQPCSAWVRRTS
jgi:Protein of unknown function (DUF2695)